MFDVVDEIGVTLLLVGCGNVLGVLVVIGERAGGKLSYGRRDYNNCIFQR